MRKTYDEYQYGRWRECNVATPVRYVGGTYGGGSENIVMEEKACDIRNSRENDTNGALQSKASNNLNSNNVVRQQYAVRRLTPTEAERLQGLPDGYTLIDCPSCSDTARYKALGNGMAQPCADFIVRRIVEEAGEE